MLEEIEMPYTVHPVDITDDAQFADDFLKISPNNKIPAIVDHDNDMTMMESGAILLYLAEKSRRLMPEDTVARWRAVEWLMFQMGGLGPMLGQAHHFLRFNKGASDYAEKRYAVEVRRMSMSWTSGLKITHTWRGNTPSPTSPHGRGFPDSSGRK